MKKEKLIREFKQKIESKNYDEAGKILQDFFAADFSPAEKGALYAHLAKTYIEASNGISGAYLSKLKKVTAELKNLSREQETA